MVVLSVVGRNVVAREIWVIGWVVAGVPEKYVVVVISSALMLA